MKEKYTNQDLIKSSKGRNGSEPTDWAGYAMVVFAGLFLAYLVAHVVAFVNSAIV